MVTKYRRAEIFKEALQFAARLPEIRIANACSTANDDERAFEYLANRINRTMKEWKSHAMLICDEGKEAAYTRLLRRMGVFNPIPSMLGGWPEGTVTRNIRTEFILEDPVFKVSQRSYFVQLADFCAYSLLRKEQPVASKSKYGPDTAFDLLDGVLLREATRYDPARRAALLTEVAVRDQADRETESEVCDEEDWHKNTGKQAEDERVTRALSGCEGYSSGGHRSRSGNGEQPPKERRVFEVVLIADEDEHRRCYKRKHQWRDSRGTSCRPPGGKDDRCEHDRIRD